MNVFDQETELSALNHLPDENSLYQNGVSEVKVGHKNLPISRATAAYISEKSRNSKKLKKYDPLYFSFLGGVILLQLF